MGFFFGLLSFLTRAEKPDSIEAVSMLCFWATPIFYRLFLEIKCWFVCLLC